LSCIDSAVERIIQKLHRQGIGEYPKSKSFTQKM